MSEIKRWIIRDQGKIKGPFSTEDVLKRISQGLFLGSEEISPFPGSEWKLISQTPEFYDFLLDILAQEVDVQKINFNKYEGEKNIQKEETKEEHTKDPFIQEETKQINQSESEKDNLDLKTKKNSTITIELVDLKKKYKKEKRKKIKGPLVFIILILIIGVGVVWVTKKKDFNKINLLRPNFGENKKILSIKDYQKELDQALGYFVLDDYVNYINAQNRFVNLVERSPHDKSDVPFKSRVLGLLCLTYRELWTFSFQDSKDIETISVVTRQALNLDPVGLYGTVCSVVDLIAKGRFKEARSLAEVYIQSLTQLDLQVSALFDVKAELIGAEKDYTSAIDSVQKAQKIWPWWLKLYSSEAKFQALNGNYSQAANLYDSIIKKNPVHGIAKIEWGILEESYFRNYDKAIKLLHSGLFENQTTNLVRAQGLMSLAKIYLNQGNKQKALQYALECTQISSGNLECRRIVMDLDGVKNLKETKTMDGVYIGDQFYKAGDCLAAQAEYKSAFENDPKNGTAAMKAATCLWQLNQSREATDWLKKAINADPKLTKAYVQLADYFSLQFDYDSAINVLKRAIREKGSMYQIFYGFSLVEYRRKNFDGAIRYGLKALELYKNDVQTNIILAQSYLEKQDFGEAFKYIARATELDSSSSEGQVVYSKVLSGLRGFESGVFYLQKLISSYPYVIEYRLALGQLYFEEDRQKEAEEIFNQVIKIDKSNKKGYIFLGKIYSAQQRLTDALDAFLMAASLDPSDAEALFLVGQYYLQKNSNMEAIRQFDRVLKTNPRYPLAHYLIGRAALNAGDKERAIKEAEEESKINPNVADSYLLAAEVYIQTHEYMKCADQIRKAIALRSQGADIYVKLGQCYRLAGQYDAALANLRVAEEKESGNPFIYREVGLIFEAKGQFQEAVTALEKYLQLAPNADDKNEIQTKKNQIERMY